MTGEARLRRGVALRVGGVGAARSAIIVLPLVVLPVLAAKVGRDEWIALGIGQSMGALAAVVAAGGWSLSGPPLVALNERDPRAVLTDALRSQCALLVAVTPLACLVAWAAAPKGGRLLAVLMTAAAATAGISPSWFLAVRGEIGHLLLVDVMPRVAAGVLAAGLVARWGADAAPWYPLLTLLAGLAGPAWYATTFLTSPDSPTAAVLRGQLMPLLSTLVAAGYSAAAVTLVALVADHDGAAEFASGFRLYVVALAATVVVNQSTQQWARAGRGGTAGERSLAMRLYALVSLALLAGFATVGAPASRLLFGDDFGIGRATALALGVACAVLTMESFVTTHLVAPFGRHTEILRAALVGAVVGVPMTLIAAHRFGAPGGAWSLVASESLVTLVLLGFARRQRRR